MRQLKGFSDLREQSRMTWSEHEHGWVAAPEEILSALSRDGFEECKREMTTSRLDRQPAGGLWQGVEYPHGIRRVGDLGASPGTASCHRVHRGRWGPRQISWS